jgi:hypothetical protein
MLWESNIILIESFILTYSKTIGTNYLIKENSKAFLVVVVKRRHHANDLLTNELHLALFY